MARRGRPPATAREIGAWLAGARLAATWIASDTLTGPDRTWVLERLAGEDAEILASMDETVWWRHFWTGWADELARTAPE